MSIVRAFLMTGLFLTSLSSFGSTVTWESRYTNVKDDCFDVSLGNKSAEIDFYEAECKSYGGYGLRISGGDLRYAPVVTFGELQFDFGMPAPFHDLGSNFIEWIYKLEKENDGAEKITWAGLIFRLSIANEDGVYSTSQLYAVRLDGTRSCLVGTTQNNQEARELIYNSKEDCK